MKAALLFIALLGATAVNGLDVISFQDKLNTQEAAVVGAEQSLVVAAQASNSPVNPVLIDQFKQLEQSINTAEGSLSLYSQSPAVAIANVDNNIDFALALINSITASTMDAQPTLTTVRDSLCQLAAAIHTSAAKDGTPVASHTPSRCFTNQAPTLLWQVQLNDANAKVVSIQNGLTSQALKATQDLTQTIQEAAAGASLYSQDPTTGFNQMTSSITQAQVQIAALMPLLKDKTKQATLQAVNSLLSSVQSSVTTFAKGSGVTGQKVAATAVKAHKTTHKAKKPAKKTKGKLSIASYSDATVAEAPAPVRAWADAPAHAPAHAPAPARRLLM